MVKGKPQSSIQKIFILCIASALGNEALSILVSGVFGAPLYLDTVFTVAITFSFGLLPGMLTGVLLYPLCENLKMLLLDSGEGIFWAGNAFVLCTVTEILLVCFFRSRLKMRQEFFISTAANLMVLVVLDCILISIMGGVIDFILHNFVSVRQNLYPEDIFKLGLIRTNVPVLPAAILSRIPINIVDRFIAIFGGYGISLLYQKPSKT